MPDSETETEVEESEGGSGSGSESEGVESKKAAKPAKPVTGKKRSRGGGRKSSGSQGGQGAGEPHLRTTPRILVARRCAPFAGH